MNPTAHIAVNKNRVKVYDGKNVFLKNGQEFQFELFNPTQERIVAKIRVNGKDISNDGSGLIIEPGRRLYLERYLSTPKKFQFQTYEVDDNNKDVEHAIARNGDIEIFFYKEAKPEPPQIKYVPVVIKEVPIVIEKPTPWWHTPYYGTISTDKTFLGNVNYNTSESNYKNDVRCSNDAVMDNCLFSQDSSIDNAHKERSRGFSNMKLCRSANKQETKETGMISQGSYSAQSMKTVDMVFESFYFHSVTYKIYPESRKEFVTEDEVQMHCTNCGRKKKKDSWKYCPSCGTKI